MKVSICMITYNHENFIREAIEGVLNQDVFFNIELIVANDKSTDNTHDIIEKIINTHPKGGLINYHNHEKNLGMMSNFIFALEQCKGEYIALCEGDDYWIDNKKLSKQVDFLDKNSDYNICFHKVKILKKNVLVDEDITEDRFSKIKSRPISILDLLEQGNFIHTPSVIFRNKIKKFPFEFYKSTVGDYFLHIMNAQDGYIKRLDDAMAVYRSGVGVFSSLPFMIMNKKILKYETVLLSYLTSEKHKQIIINKHIAKIDNLDALYLNPNFLSSELSFKEIILIFLKKIKIRIRGNE